MYELNAVNPLMWCGSPLKNSPFKVLDEIEIDNIGQKVGPTILHHILIMQKFEFLARFPKETKIKGLTRSRQSIPESPNFSCVSPLPLRLRQMS